MGLFERRVYIMYLPNCCIVIEKVENVESDIEYHSQVRKTKSDATLCQKKRIAPRSAHQPITQMMQPKILWRKSNYRWVLTRKDFEQLKLILQRILNIYFSKAPQLEIQSHPEESMKLGMHVACRFSKNNPIQKYNHFEKPVTSSFPPTFIQNRGFLTIFKMYTKTLELRKNFHRLKCSLLNSLQDTAWKFLNTYVNFYTSSRPYFLFP